MEPQEYHNLREVEDTHWWFQSLHELILSALRKHGPPGKLRIFDAGCGTSGLAAKMRKLGTVEGVDLSPIAIAHCGARGLPGMRVADLNTLTLPAESYDVIVSVDVLYHRGIDDPAKILRMFHTGLKPGGVVFLHLPAFEAFRSAHDLRVHTGRRFRLGATKRFLREAGFTVLHGSYRIGILLPLILATRALRKISGDALSDVHPVPNILNTPLLILCRMEDALTRLLPLPIGLSLYTIARKPLH